MPPSPPPLDALDSLAKKGKLPGYQRLSDTTFRVDAFGHPFDASLVGTIQSTDPRTIHFDLRARHKMPAIFAIITLLSIWPGVLITDSLIPGRWGWWPTAYWYFPLTIIPLPFVTRTIIKKTRSSTRQHAQQQIKTICQALNATASGPAVESQSDSSPS